MVITTAMIKELREATGVGPLECKKALEASQGDLAKAAGLLREKGLAKAANKVGRETKAGLVIVKTSVNCAGMVEVQCETDFVARTGEFKTLAHRLADQILADARLTDVEALLTADFSAAPGRTNAEVIKELIGRLGENIVVRQVARYPLRDTALVEAYLHTGDVDASYGPMEGRIGVLVELGVSDKAVADGVALRALAHDLVLQITAGSPTYLAPGDVPEAVVDKELEDLRAQLAGEEKPEAVKAKIIAGRLSTFYQRSCLLKQAFAKDESVSIEELLQQKSREMGVALAIQRFARFEAGA